jgi:hypothetical protein
MLLTIKEHKLWLSYSHSATGKTPFMEPTSSLLYSDDTTTGPTFQPHEFSLHLSTLQNHPTILLPSILKSPQQSLQNKTKQKRCACICACMCVCVCAHVHELLIPDSEYKLWSSVPKGPDNGTSHCALHSLWTSWIFIHNSDLMNLSLKILNNPSSRGLWHASKYHKICNPLCSISLQLTSSHLQMN